MFILPCSKCGELQIRPGSPDNDGVARAVWTCPKCGVGQMIELSLPKEAKRGDLRNVIGGLALAVKDRKKYEIAREHRDEYKL